MTRPNLTLLSLEGEREKFIAVLHEITVGEVGILPLHYNVSSNNLIFDFISLLLCLAEVARTRLREGNPRYHKFWQTIFLVYREEGRRGLYRGMVTQLCRQIPNTAIMMVTYEFVVYGLSRKVIPTLLIVMVPVVWERS